MALSRAAAAAARKAAKNRGLKGNRAKDGSMLSEDPRYTVGPDTDQLSFYEQLTSEMSDAQLNKAWIETKQEIRELQEMEASRVEIAKAEEKLDAIKAEMEDRGGIGEWYEDEELDLAEFNERYVT